MALSASRLSTSLRNDGSEELREGLTRLLTEAGHEVAAAEGDAEKFLRAVAARPPGRGGRRCPDATHLY